eukprot:836241-Alexandrium_andersonii.AAC.1
MLRPWRGSDFGAGAPAGASVNRDLWPGLGAGPSMSAELRLNNDSGPARRDERPPGGRFFTLNPVQSF